MEQETKTVTMPLSEYERMREEVALFRSKINPHEERIEGMGKKIQLFKRTIR